MFRQFASTQSCSVTLLIRGAALQLILLQIAAGSIPPVDLGRVWPAAGCCSVGCVYLMRLVNWTCWTKLLQSSCWLLLCSSLLCVCALLCRTPECRHAAVFSHQLIVPLCRGSLGNQLILTTFFPRHHAPHIFLSAFKYFLLALKYFYSNRNSLLVWEYIFIHFLSNIFTRINCMKYFYRSTSPRRRGSCCATWTSPPAASSGARCPARRRSSRPPHTLTCSSSSVGANIFLSFSQIFLTMLIFLTMTSEVAWKRKMRTAGCALTDLGCLNCVGKDSHLIVP